MTWRKGISSRTADSKRWNDGEPAYDSSPRMIAPHCSALIALVPESVSRSMITSFEWIAEQVPVRTPQQVDALLARREPDRLHGLDPERFDDCLHGGREPRCVGATRLTHGEPNAIRCSRIKLSSDSIVSPRVPASPQRKRRAFARRFLSSQPRRVSEVDRRRDHERARRTEHHVAEAREAARRDPVVLVRSRCRRAHGSRTAGRRSRSRSARRCRSASTNRASSVLMPSTNCDDVYIARASSVSALERRQVPFDVDVRLRFRRADRCLALDRRDCPSSVISASSQVMPPIRRTCSIGSPKKPASTPR